MTAATGEFMLCSGFSGAYRRETFADQTRRTNMTPEKPIDMDPYGRIYVQ